MSFSWRWAFGINIPLGVVVLAGLLMLVPESRGDRAERGNDLIGALLTVIGLTGIVFALIEGRTEGWWTRIAPVHLLGMTVTSSLSPVPVAALIGVVSLVIFVFFERRRNRQGKPVLLDLRLFAIPSFRNGNIAAAIVSLGEFGILFALPLWLENVSNIGVPPRANSDCRRRQGQRRSDHPRAEREAADRARRARRAERVLHRHPVVCLQRGRLPRPRPRREHVTRTEPPPGRRHRRSPRRR